MSATSLQEIIKAHHEAKLTLCLHGSSGYGKTSSVRAAVTALGYKMHDFRLADKDPLTLFLPREKGGVIKNVLSEILDVVFKAETPTVVFLDEITNASTPEIYSIMKELLNERTFLGKSIPDCVSFVAATNFVEEDIGVKEMPDSLKKRMTHLQYTPGVTDLLAYMPEPLQEFFSDPLRSGLMPEARSFDLNIEACPRQTESVHKLYAAGLRGTSLRRCAIGLVGESLGIPLAAYLEDYENKKAGVNSDEKKWDLPQHLTVENTVRPVVYVDLKIEGKEPMGIPAAPTDGTVATLLQMEDAGCILDVLAYIRKPGHNPRALAYYLALFAGPEVCRSIYDEDMLKPADEKRFVWVEWRDWDPNKQHPYEGLKYNDMPWPYRAWERGAISVGFEEDTEMLEKLAQAAKEGRK